MAIALSDETLRRRVFEDLRDSPFPQHRIHLASYLSGARGSVVLARAATAAGKSQAQLITLAAARGGLQLAMPRSGDRITWAGTSDIAVKGTAQTLRERAEQFRREPYTEFAYRTDGTRLPHGILTESLYPFLVISASEVNLGASPEVARAASPRQTRQTVSTPDEEIALYKARGDSVLRTSPALTPRGIIECPPEGCGGGGGGGGRPMGVSIPSGKTYADCYQPGGFNTTVDRDQDGVDDQCEAELALAFRPQMKLMQDDCDTRSAPHFAVRQKFSQDWGGVIYIFYAISYVYDCGPPFTCTTAFPACDNHLGDSEWIILEVGPSANSSHGPWSLKFGTMSAHWQSENDQTAGYAAYDLEDADGSPGFGAPLIWAAEDKHANYRSQVSCDSSGWFNVDNCDNPWPAYFTLGFGPEHNLGHGGPGREFIGSAGTPVPDRLTGNGNVEYFWTNSPAFCGWIYYVDGDCAASYNTSLTAYGFRD